MVAIKLCKKQFPSSVVCSKHLFVVLVCTYFFALIYIFLLLLLSFTEVNRFVSKPRFEFRSVLHVSSFSLDQQPYWSRSSQGRLQKHKESHN